MAFANIPTNFDAGSSLRSALANAPVENQQLYSQGLQTGQQAATLNALAGININDPNSVNQGIANLVKHGAADQASALINLGITRQIAPRIPGILDSIGGLGSQSSAAPAEPSAPAAQPGQPNAQGAADNMAFSLQSGQQLLAADPADRPALAAQIKQAALARGFPEGAIDANLADLTTPGLQAKVAELQSHADHMTASVPGLAQGATVPPLAAGGYPWAQQLLNNPGQQAGLDILKHFGYDLTGLADTAKAIQAPTIAKQAELGAAEPIARASYLGSNPTMQVMVNGTPHTLPTQDALALLNNPSAQSLGIGTGIAPGQEAGAAAKATAPYQDVTVKGPNGEEITMSRAEFASRTGGGTTFTGPTVGGAENLKGQSDALNTYTAALPAQLDASKVSLARAQALIGLAGQVGTGAYTQALKNAAQYLPATHSLQQYAADAGLLSQDLSASFKDGLQGLAVPRVAVEAKGIMGGIPTSVSQPDQIRAFAAGNAALAQYNTAHALFIQDWASKAGTGDPTHPPSLAAANAAWAAGPGSHSLFAEPAWQGVTLGGKPAVDNHTYQGHNYLIVMPGLLGKNARVIPES